MSRSTYGDLAEAYLMTGQVEKARGLLDAIDVDALPDDCQLEYWDVRGRMAIVDADKDHLAAVLQALRSLDPRPQYFKIVRDRLCVELSLAFEKRELPCTTSERGKAHRILAKLRTLLQCVDIKPSICGIGLNVNKIIEWFLGTDKE